MRLVDLALLYGVAGAACAVAIWRTSPDRGPRALAAAALAIPLWPLWAPVALTSRPHGAPFGARSRGVAAQGAASSPAVAEAAARVEAALREGVEACAGTALEALLSRDAAGRIAAEVARAASRHAELDALLAREGFDLAAAERRLADLEQACGRGGAVSDASASPRAVATARLHMENVRRLHALRDRDARALGELADLVSALRTQLVLARFAGSSIEGASGIVSEMWARVEGLGAAMDAHDAPGHDAPGPSPRPSPHPSPPPEASAP